MTKRNANILCATVVAVSVMFIVVLVLYARKSVSYEENLLSDAEELMAAVDFGENNPYLDGSAYVKVTHEQELNENGGVDYIVDITGNKKTVTFYPRKERTIPNPTDLTAPSKAHKKLIDKSKKLICKYIDKSTVLQDKERLKQSIKEVEVLEGRSISTDPNAIASFLDSDGKIYISKEVSEDQIAENVLVHEMVHALAYYTRGDKFASEEYYGLTLFDEVMTDQIANSMNPEKQKGGWVSGYEAYYQYTLPYIERMGTEAIKAYFYGYDEVEKELGEDEFKVYVGLINYTDEDFTLVYNGNMTLKWHSESHI